ncbi:phospholipase [Rhodohalobacter sp. SW132]|uniref:alpha/beta hydrolase n=1 Tax=Rhodohalobacter sp. SW132 TaxID=2293433 RepID=UPI000E241D03|nr:dienelactone hydrolase family protein [Rhodohalobacter sp. SW132]REL38473.1 phospholipase [Rhodohalobacter sp. SW132]
MFRADKKSNFQGPHQNQQTATAGASKENAKAAMILIHGRGASAQSILTLANEFSDPDLHYVAPQANDHQWYPNSFLAPSEKNEPGLSSGLQMIYDLVSDLGESGIPKEKIIILGFSQGACLASEFVARHPAKYGGLAALSGGLIGKGDHVPPDSYSGDLEKTPLFFGCSNIDPHIPKERVDESEEIFNSLNGDVNKKIYKGMGHTVNEDEILEIQKLIQNVTEA